MANYTYSVITRWNEDNKVIKHKSHGSLKDAETHLAEIISRYPDAFIAEIASLESQRSTNWLVNPANKTLSYVPYEESQEEVLTRLAKSAIRAEYAKMKEEMLTNGTTEEALLYQNEKASAE